MESGGRKPWLVGPGGKREGWHCHGSQLSWHLPKGSPGVEGEGERGSVGWDGCGCMTQPATLSPSRAAV